MKSTDLLNGHMGMSIAVSCILFAGFSNVYAGEEVPEEQALTAESFYRIAQISQPSLSPDGQHIILTKREVKEDKRGWNSNLWLVDTSSKVAPRQFTFSNADYGAKWSPDSEYLLVNSARSGSSGLYQLRVRGGEAQPMLKLEQGSISDYEWSATQDSLLLTIRLNTDVSDPRSDSENKDDSADVMEARHAVYKTQGNYIDHDRESSLWLYNIEADELQNLTHGNGYDESGAQFSPNGSKILFTSNRDADAREGAYSQSLFVLDLAGLDSSPEPYQINTPSGRVGQAVWFDNESIVYTHSKAPYAATSLRRAHIGNNSGEVLETKLEYTPQSLEVVDGTIYFIADIQGSSPLVRYNLSTKTFTNLVGEGSRLSAFKANQHGFSAVRDNEAELPELVYADWASSDSLQPLTDFNQDLQNQVNLNGYHSFQVTGESGYQTDGFFLEPSNRQTDRSYPLILNIKGGPGGMWGHQFMLEMQLMAARGYAVVFVNYRGSSGYGQDFSDQVRVDYGGADYEDNMLAVDYILQNYDWIDPDRLFITGGSHGGFLTNWITTQTDRFKAAVTQRSVSNWLSEAGTQAFPPASMSVEFGGTIWQNFDYYWGRSPLKYADQVTTPTLIIHSTDDHITPIGQGEEWFYALKANNVETEMVVFRNEGHGLSRNGLPINLVERLNRIINWFDRYNQ